MPKLTSAELREQLDRDIPGALVPLGPVVTSATSGHGEALPRKKGEHAPVNLLATQDVVVRPEQIGHVARYMRDTLEHELLTNITAVDFLSEGVIEIVYHFARLGGGVLPIKVRVPRETPVLPSLTPFWPGADFQEREAFDLYGVIFKGHESLKRIYMWDEFEGFPMRKDFPKQGDKYFAEGE